ncbi:uncharacterized protein LOC131669570 [Phymastichus coffea]|uniref:uncharacterized protein LOC131669570 n=1 Tax=Phymastichus coffea TaxID=108790 RepID=UPI00273B737A|nr:uncharacterized protein LOC131669570 [Phymastichus coffea]
MARMLSCLRGFLLGFVVIVGFSGAIVVAGSSIFLYQLHEYSLLTPSNVDGPPGIMLGLGILTCAVAWFVWHFDYSAKAQIISLATLIAAIAIVEISIGIWALVRHQQIYALPENVVQKAIVTLNDPRSDDLWHKMHVKLNCCGVNGASEDFRQKHKHVPWSCCYELHESEDEKKKCERGCHHPMIHRTQSILLYAFLLALSSFILKACTVALAWCYAKSIAEAIKKRRKEIEANHSSTMISSAAQASSINKLQPSRL